MAGKAPSSAKQLELLVLDALGAREITLACDSARGRQVASCRA
jgi:hypothetical protein